MWRTSWRGKIRLQRDFDLLSASAAQELSQRIYKKFLAVTHLGEPSDKIFGQTWDFVPLFIKIDQDLICLGTVHKCDKTHST